MAQTMPPTQIDLRHAIFAKTAIGQHEIATRAMGLAPLTRRLLILVDGKRSGQELAVFVDGHPVDDLLRELLTRQCIEALAANTATAPDNAAPSRGPQDALTGLPAPEHRSAAELEMARHFMINTLNMAFGQNMRMSLVKAIDDSATVSELRQVYPLWLSTMASSRSAAKELPALQSKLFRVL